MFSILYQKGTLCLTQKAFNSKACRTTGIIFLMQLMLLELSWGCLNYFNIDFRAFSV